MELLLSSTSEENRYRQSIEAMGVDEWLNSMTWHGLEFLSRKNIAWLRRLIAASGRLSEDRLHQMLHDSDRDVRNAAFVALNRRAA